MSTRFNNDQIIQSVYKCLVHSKLYKFNLLLVTIVIIIIIIIIIVEEKMQHWQAFHNESRRETADLLKIFIGEVKQMLFLKISLRG